jgi:hypothetical protein
MKRAAYIIVAFLFLFQASCDKTEVWPRVDRDDVPGIDYLAVLSTTPTHGQTGVPVSATISIKFSDNINDTTLDSGTTLLLNGGPVGGFSYDNISRILEITPGGLSYDTVYTVRLTTGIETLVGDTLEADYQFQFTTVAAGTPVIEVSHTGLIVPHMGIYEFGLTDIGSPLGETFRIDNPGDAVLDISSMTLGGINPGDFTIAPFTGTIPAGGFNTFSVNFDPVSTGDKSALISINSNAVVNPFQFTVTGSAVSAGTFEPDITLYQGTTEIAYNDQYNFAKYGLGEVSPPIPFTIKNQGNANLNVTAIQLTDDAGGRFIIVTNPAPVTISPGNEDDFTIQFSSPNGVVFFGTVEITSNDPDEDPFVFKVKGMAK